MKRLNTEHHVYMKVQIDTSNIYISLASKNTELIRCFLFLEFLFIPKNMRVINKNSVVHKL